METTTTEVIELKDCNKFLSKNLDSNEVLELSKLCDCNYPTIRRYLGGFFPDNSLFKNVSPKVVKFGFEIVLRKTKELNESSESIVSEMNNILSGKQIPLL